MDKPHLTDDIKITSQKWDEAYKEEHSKANGFDPNNVPEVVKISSQYVKDFLLSSSRAGTVQGEVFLEAGCGTARTSLNISLDTPLTILCLDRSSYALTRARNLFRKHNKTAKVYFICGDLTSIPFKNNTVNFIFSDGAIEHFKNTQGAVNELYRITKQDGSVFATVPHMALSMLTYGQLQGNIPNVFILRNVFEYIHLKILGARLMSNGFEFSFTRGNLTKIFKSAGFKEVTSDHFNTFNEIRFVSNQTLKNVFRWLSTTRLFWPLIYVNCKKL